MQRIARLVDRERHDVEEHVGADRPRHARSRPAPPTWPAPTVSGPRCANSHCSAHLRQAQRIAHVVVERALLLQLDDDARLVVVLQVAADLGRIDATTSMPWRAKQRRRADAGELEQLRRLQRAGREDHLARRRAPALLLPGLDPSRRRGRDRVSTTTRVTCAPVTTLRLGRCRAGARKAVAASQRQPAAQRELVAAEAVGDGAVEVVGERMPGLGAGGEPGRAVRMVVAQVGDAELARGAVVLALAALVSLRSA